MSHNYRRFIAASCAIVCAASMTGCSDSGYIGTINGMQILMEFTFTIFSSQRIMRLPQK